MFEKVLVATDGSHSSEKAVQFAADLARAYGSELLFCTVTHTAITSAAGGEPDPTPEDEGSSMGAAISDQGREILRRAEQAAKAAGVGTYRLIEAYGTNIGATIVKEAETAGADHIVVGSVGSTGLARLLLGSVASSVIHHAHCPVTVVR